MCGAVPPFYIRAIGMLNSGVAKDISRRLPRDRPLMSIEQKPPTECTFRRRCFFVLEAIRSREPGDDIHKI